MEFNDIAKAFDLGTVTDALKLKGGLVNTSYKVKTDRGIYVFQNLAPVIPIESTQRYVQVEQFLRHEGVFVPYLLTLPDGNPHAENTSGHWRVFKYVRHDEDMDDKKSCIISAAQTLGKFHSVMAQSGLSYKTLIEHFHDTPYYKERLFAYDSNELSDEIRLYMQRLSKKTQTGLAEYPIIPIHGDPKLENFLFKDSKVTAVLDLDTIMDANPLIDIGDALRSWCCTNSNEFNEEYFTLVLDSYNDHAPFEISTEDAIGATTHICAELGMRFLTDSFEESYFAWDSNKYKSSKEHNLERTRELLTYISSIEKSQKKVPLMMEELVPA